MKLDLETVPDGYTRKNKKNACLDEKEEESKE